jgi:hypothetical protein
VSCHVVLLSVSTYARLYPTVVFKLAARIYNGLLLSISKYYLHNELSTRVIATDLSDEQADSVILRLPWLLAQFSRRGCPEIPVHSGYRGLQPRVPLLVPAYR